MPLSAQVSSWASREGRGSRLDPRGSTEVRWNMPEGTMKSTPAEGNFSILGKPYSKGLPNVNVFLCMCKSPPKAQPIRCWLPVAPRQSQEHHLMSKKTSFKSLSRWSFYWLGSGWGLWVFQQNQEAGPKYTKVLHFGSMLANLQPKRTAA